MKSSRKVTVKRDIAASPQDIFNVLANPQMHPRIDGSGAVQQVRNAPVRLSQGATFSMDMKNRVPYLTKNVVVAFEEDRTIAWHHFARFVWRYDLAPHDDGTTVTESFDYSPPWGVFLIPLKIPDQNRVGMEKSLARLAALLESSGSSSTQ